MRILSQNIQKMPRSGIRVIMDMATQLDEVFHLELGEPGFPIPDHIQEAAVRAMHDGFTKYTPNAGFLSLRERILEKVQKENRIRADLEQIAATPGSVFGVVSAMMTIAEPGDEILLPDPGWPNYYMQAVSLGLKPVFYRIDPAEGFQPRVEKMEGLVGPKTRAIVINTPSNPTRAVFTRHTTGEIMDLARRRDLYIVSDEVYEQILYDGEHISPAALDEDERVITIFGFSKSYAMTGWRIGYYIAPRPIAREMHKILEPFASSAASVSQKAAEAALAGPQDCVAQMVRAYTERKDIVVSALEENDFSFTSPKGAFYLMVNIAGSGADSYTFAEDLLKATGVAVAPGRTFGPDSDDYIRISFCARTDELQEGIRRFCGYLKGRLKA